MLFVGHYSKRTKRLLYFIYIKEREVKNVKMSIRSLPRLFYKKS